MDYALLKTFHQIAVALSALGFFARGAGSLAGAPWVRSRAARTVPHVVDTVLLVSALAMVWQLQLNPFAAPWLAAKIGGLVVYIAVGMLALRPGLPQPLRATAWLLALAVFAYVVSVAITKNPAGFFVRL